MVNSQKGRGEEGALNRPYSSLFLCHMHSPETDPGFDFLLPTTGPRSAFAAQEVLLPTASGRGSLVKSPPTRRTGVPLPQAAAAEHQPLRTALRLPRARPVTARATWRRERGAKPKRFAHATSLRTPRARACVRHVAAGGMAEWRAVPSDLFPFVLAFLRENQCEGAARAFARETAAVSGAGGGGGGERGGG